MEFPRLFQTFFVLEKQSEGLYELELRCHLTKEDYTSIKEKYKSTKEEKIVDYITNIYSGKHIVRQIKGEKDEIYTKTKIKRTAEANGAVALTLSKETPSTQVLPYTTIQISHRHTLSDGALLIKSVFLEFGKAKIFDYRLEFEFTTKHTHDDAEKLLSKYSEYFAQAELNRQKKVIASEIQELIRPGERLVNLKVLVNKVKTFTRDVMLQNNPLNWLVTPKMDGETCVLYSHRGATFKNDEQFKTDVEDLLFCVGELMEDGTLYVFDVLVFAGKSLVELTNVERMTYPKLVEDLFAKYKDLKIIHKPMVHAKKEEDFKSMSNFHPKTDGLVLYPAFKKYYEFPAYKFKPQHLNTNDLVCVYTGSHYIFAAGIDGRDLRKTTKTRAAALKEITLAPDYYLIQLSLLNVEDFSVVKESDVEFADPAFVEVCKKQRQVVEVSFFPDKKKWKVWRIRYDKKFPNQISTAIENLLLNLSPITPEEIFAPGDTFYSDESSSQYEDLRAATKVALWDITKTYGTNKKAHFDLSAGRGNKLNMFLSNNMPNVFFCNDISTVSLQVLNERLTKLQMSKKIHISKFEILAGDLTDENDVYSMLKKIDTEKFDLVTQIYATHYMFISQDGFESFILFLNSITEKGATFITTLIDPERAIKVKQELYFIAPESKVDLNVPYGNLFNVIIPFGTSIKTQVEPMVTSALFKKTMRSKGWDVVFETTVLKMAAGTKVSEATSQWLSCHDIFILTKL